jgi:hypothetical protein
MHIPADRPDPLADNLAVLSNAVQLSTQIILKTAGNDTANTYEGATITEAFVADAVAARLQAKMAPYLGGGV